MDPKDKRQLENMLLREGLAHLGDPELIEQLANLISNWPGDKHDFLRDLLNECDIDKRYEMYHAIAPKLGFKPLSLPQYESQISLKAGAMVSQGRMRVEGDAPKPVEVGDMLAIRTTRERANAAMATVTCYHCGKFENYLGDTAVGAMIAARKAGWSRDKVLNKETCADCAAESANLEVVALSRHDKLLIKDHRRVN